MIVLEKLVSSDHDHEQDWGDSGRPPTQFTLTVYSRHYREPNACRERRGCCPGSYYAGHMDALHYGVVSKDVIYILFQPRSSPGYFSHTILFAEGGVALHQPRSIGLDSLDSARRHEPVPGPLTGGPAKFKSRCSNEWW